jgi:hypothetical protein
MKKRKLKGRDNEADILVFFCINRFGIGPLHYVSSRSDFSFEFSEIFVIEKIAYRYNFFQTFK